jgi:hypothetical protein
VDEERRLEALEAAARARKGLKAEQAQAMRPARSQRANTAGNQNMAEWKEGKLLPEGELADAWHGQCLARLCRHAHLSHVVGMVVLERRV